MRVMFVCSATSGRISPFISEQMDSLITLWGVEIKLFQIRKKGWLGYLTHLRSLNKMIGNFNPDLIHAQYGLSGLLANLQRKKPVITTFHGSDINDINILKWSKLAHRLSVASIVVEKRMIDKLNKQRRCFLIPCGVDLTAFYPIPILQSREAINIPLNSFIVLFYSGFDNPVKNYPLAKLACNLAEGKLNAKINLIELKGLSRSEVNLYMNASNCFLLYSSSEGSPQVIKEAMACNCPIVTTDVGDVTWVIGKTEGCFVTSSEVEDVAEKLVLAKEFYNTYGRTNGRERIKELQLDNVNISHRIFEVYNTILVSKK